jgi:hypothetical protein
LIVKIFLLSGTWLWVADLAAGFLFGLFESVALPVGFDNVDSVSQAVEESSGEPLGTEDLGPAPLNDWSNVRRVEKFAPHAEGMDT